MKNSFLLATFLGMAVLLIVPARAGAYPRYRDRRTPGYPPAYVAPPPRAQPQARYAPYDEGSASRTVDTGIHGYVGIGGVAGWVGGDTGARTFGGSMAGGFDLFGGVELGRWVALELDWRYLALRDDAYVRTSLNQVTAGAKVFLLPDGWRVRPYAAIGLGLAVLSPLATDRPRPVGPSLDLGVGVDVPLASHFAIGAKMSWRPMFLDASDLGAPRGAGRTDLHDLSLSLRVQVTF
jgi:hypothetical protein